MHFYTLTHNTLTHIMAVLWELNKGHGGKLEDFLPFAQFAAGGLQKSLIVTRSV